MQEWQNLHNLTLKGKMELQKIGIKLFVDPTVPVEVLDFTSIFHELIQNQAVADHLLIDVADYTHVPAGPGLLLVGHEADFSLDLKENRLGLFYYRKQPLEGDFDSRMKTITKTVFQIASLLEEKGKIRFQRDGFEWIANDRLLAPNTEESYQEISPQLAKVLSPVYPKVELNFASQVDSRQRLNIHVKAEAQDFNTTLEKLAA